MFDTAHPTPSAPLLDPFGRLITYLRISVTDRCDFRCLYCMPENMRFLPKTDLLTLEEVERLAENFIALGTRKIRLTGGEPLVRRNVIHLIERLGAWIGQGLDELTLTTNGSQLLKYADALARAGIKRINVSLDTLDADKFATLTRRGKLGPVLDGVAAAKAAGLSIKINTVALKGFNEEEFDPMIAWCGTQGFDLVFIEVMPMGDLGAEDRLDQYLPLSRLRADLKQRWTLTETGYRTGGPARYWRIAETGQRLGFITPMTHNFCESCNRVRLTCTGTLYLCLGQEDSVDLRIPLRDGRDEAGLQEAVRRAIARKPKGHDFKIDRALSALSRHMNVTGG